MQPHCPLCRCKQSFDAALPNRGLEALLGYDKKDVLAAVKLSKPAAPVYDPTPPPAREHTQRHGHYVNIPSTGWPGAPVAASSWREWWHENEPRLRCIMYVVLIVTLMVFLRVQEEEYQEMEEDLLRMHQGHHLHMRPLSLDNTHETDRAVLHEEAIEADWPEQAGLTTLDPVESYMGAADRFERVPATRVEAAWAAEKAHPISHGDSSYVGDAHWAALGLVGTFACVMQVGRKALGRRRVGRRVPSRAGSTRRRRRPDGSDGETGSYMSEA